MLTEEKKRNKRPLILIAEDIPRNMEVVCNILKTEEYRLAMAGNGKQAVEMVPAAMPDLILLDVMMPEMNGFDVCRQLKKNPATKDIPVIFLTAKADTIDVVKGFEIGAVDYVTKPFKGSELLSRVKTHLELKFAREELNELNATKDIFFSIIAHDLKDPLQYLLLATDSLTDNYENFNEEKKRDYIRRMQNNSQHLSALLENLLSWSRSQRGLIEPEPDAVDVNELISECLELHQNTAQKKGITLVSQVDHGTYAYADRNMIKTVMRNLISNAIKFTGGEGKITIHASLTASEERIKISVVDTGVGLDQEGLRGLFRIDAKKSTRGTTGETGTGLGLILCKQFIDLNYGTIDVSSQPNEGTQFIITLPVEP